MQTGLHLLLEARLQIVSIAEEEDGKKTFRQKAVKDLSKADLQAVVQAAMATKDPDNRVYFTRLKERMDKCAQSARTMPYTQYQPAALNNMQLSAILCLTPSINPQH